MTASDLIKELSKYPSEKDVRVFDNEWSTYDLVDGLQDHEDFIEITTNKRESIK